MDNKYYILVSDSGSIEKYNIITLKMDYNCIFKREKPINNARSLKALAMTKLADCYTIEDIFPNFSTHAANIPKTDVINMPTYYIRLGPYYAKRLSPAPIIKTILPQELYHDYLFMHLLDNALNWEIYLREVLVCGIEDIQYFDFTNLTVEEALIVKTFPYQTYEACDNTILVSFLYCYIDVYKNICLKCVNKCKIQQFTICSDAYVLQKTDIPNLFKYNWCSNCHLQPLFQFISFDKDDSEMAILKNKHDLNVHITKKRPNTQCKPQKRIKRTKSF